MTRKSQETIKFQPILQIIFFKSHKFQLMTDEIYRLKCRWLTVNKCFIASSINTCWLLIIKKKINLKILWLVLLKSYDKENFYCWNQVFYNKCFKYFILCQFIRHVIKMHRSLWTKWEVISIHCKLGVKCWNTILNDIVHIS